MLRQWHLSKPNLRIDWSTGEQFHLLAEKTWHGLAHVGKAARTIGWPAGEHVHVLADKTRHGLAQLGKGNVGINWPTGEQFYMLAQKTWHGLGQFDGVGDAIGWPVGEQFHMAAERTWHGLGRSLVGSYAGLALKLNVSWHAPLPDGPKIIAANHPTTVDPALVMMLAPKQSSILIHETLFKVPVLGRYLQRAGHVPVIPGNGRAALEEAKRLLEAGRTIVIFPEGALSPLEGGFHRPHTGAARLSLSTGAPIIPVGIHLERERIHLIENEVEGKTEVGRLYLQGPYAMTVGEAMTLTGDVEDREYVRSVSMRIMRRIMSLTQESALRMQASRMPRTMPIPASLAFATIS
jgi:1-acyl-sn-glycerol-3-phosphate acyltransferase